LTELAIGTLLALAALTYVLYPMFISAGNAVVISDERVSAAGEEDRNSAVDALREIEFDRATGKLSDYDYDALKSSYTRRAVAAMRAGGAGNSPVCEQCGPRPETGAVYCSSCGGALVAGVLGP